MRKKKNRTYGSIDQAETIHEWLNMHGGRNKNDMYKDEKGLYILTQNADRTQTKIYLPDYLI